MPGCDQHAERHHHHEVLLVLAVDLAHRRRHQHHARVAVETLVMRQADIELLLLLLAVLVLADGGRLLAQLHPGALGRLPELRAAAGAAFCAGAAAGGFLAAGGAGGVCAAAAPIRPATPSANASAAAPSLRNPASCNLQCAICHRGFDLFPARRLCRPRAPEAIVRVSARVRAVMAGMRQSRDVAYRERGNVCLTECSRDRTATQP